MLFASVAYVTAAYAELLDECQRLFVRACDGALLAAYGNSVDRQWSNLIKLGNVDCLRAKLLHLIKRREIAIIGTVVVFSCCCCC